VGVQQIAWGLQKSTLGLEFWMWSGLTPGQKRFQAVHSRGKKSVEIQSWVIVTVIKLGSFTQVVESICGVNMCEISSHIQLSHFNAV
jgi:hypothetical protein